MTRLKLLVPVLRQSIRDWRTISPGILAGALAYFTSVSLPALVLVVGALLGRFIRAQQVYERLYDTVGSKTTRAALYWVNMARLHRSPTSTLFSSILLVVVASRVFAHLQTVFQIVWRKAPYEHSIRRGFIKQTVIPAIFIAATAVFILIYIWVMPHEDGLGFFWRQVSSFAASTVIFAAVFALINRSLAPVILSWRAVAPGAVVTSLLFAAVRLALLIYVSMKSFRGLYGSAGSLVLVMVWIYFCAHAFVFGAVLTRRFVLEQSKS